MSSSYTLPSRNATTKDVCVSIRNVSDSGIVLYSGGRHYTSMTVYRDPFHRAFTFGSSTNSHTLHGYDHLPPRYHVEMSGCERRMASFSGPDGDLLMGGSPRSFLLLVPRPGRQLSFLEAFVPSAQSHIAVIPQRTGGVYRITPGTIVVCLLDETVNKALAKAKDAFKEKKKQYPMDAPENVFACVNVFLQTDPRSQAHTTLLQDSLGLVSTYALKAHRQLLPRIMHDLSIACMYSSDYLNSCARIAKTDPKDVIVPDLVFEDLCFEPPVIEIGFVNGSPMLQTMPGTMPACVPYTGWPTLNDCRVCVRSDSSTAVVKKRGDEEAESSESDKKQRI